MATLKPRTTPKASFRILLFDPHGKATPRDVGGFANQVDAESYADAWNAEWSHTAPATWCCSNWLVDVIAGPRGKMFKLHSAILHREGIEAATEYNRNLPEGEPQARVRIQPERNRFVPSEAQITERAEKLRKDQANQAILKLSCKVEDVLAQAESQPDTREGMLTAGALARIAVETMAREIAIIKDVDYLKNDNASKVIFRLQKKGAISSRHARTMHRLFDSGNRFVHNRFSSEAGVRDYVFRVKAVALSLGFIQPEGQEFQAFREIGEVA